MKNITIQLLEFSELSQNAKEKALEANRDINVDNDYWYDSIYGHFIDLCKLLGIETSWKTICFRGFWSQGDGSAFEGTVSISQLIKATEHNTWKEQYPEIALAFPSCPCDRRIIGLIENDLIDTCCKITQRSHRHYNVSVAVDADFNYCYTACHNYDRIDGQLNALQHWLDGIAAILNRYLYESLRQEYDFMTTDAAVQETIEANTFHFAKNGEMAIHMEALAE